MDGVNVDDIIKSIVKSDRKAAKMNALYQNEVSNRGKNVFALYSAFTNYASYADEQNGFNSAISESLKQYMNVMDLS